jgi:tRNA threonylcarbamoyladenosine biosynthesis protein TsaB
VVPVSDLAALAAAAVRTRKAEWIMACLDARMHEVYWAAYESRPGGLVPLSEETLSPPSQVEVPSAGPWFGAGPGWAAYDEALRDRIPQLTGTDPALLPTAGDVARLGQATLLKGESVAPERALPVYLRDRVATPKA